MIVMLQARLCATMDEIIAAAQLLAQIAGGAMSGALCTKLALVMASDKRDGRGRVYRINR